MIATTELAPSLEHPDSLSCPTEASELRWSWLLLAQVPLFVAAGWNLWIKPQYQFFPLAIIAAILLARSSLRRQPLKPGKSATAMAMLVVNLTLQLAGFLLHSSWLIEFSLLLFFVTSLYACGGWRGVYACWPSVGLVALCVPVPFGFDNDVVLWLRNVTTALGSDVLNFLEMPHLRYGNTLQVEDRKLFVEEACSGINSLFSTFCFILIWAGVSRLRLVETILLLAAAFGWVLVANTLRVVLVAVGISWWDVDLSVSWHYEILGSSVAMGPHEALGIGTFLLALFLTWDTRQLVLFLFPVRPKSQLPTADCSLPTIVCHPAKRWALLGSAALISLGFVLVYRHDFHYFFSDKRDREVAQRLNQIKEDDLPAEVGRWHTREFKVEKRDMSNQLGENSKSWSGNIGPHSAWTSIDYAFLAWHDLSACYRWQGWQIEAQNDIASPNGDGKMIKEVLMKRPGMQSGYLIYTFIDVHGEALPPLGQVHERSNWRRPDSVIGGLTGPKNASNSFTDVAPSTCQVQVFMTGAGEFSPEMRAAAAEVLKTACAIAKGRITGN
jgi:exosortase